ncbi:Wzz/FepE/Etk N-terminal domain-containing protein [Hippea sp. KM1]|uniref:Wzz/FepE/Etk N-terminal domain-containing protein n=1 Tax=Hippea sp. KM1 TaxID=944481 RepID=UPI00046C8D5E|nr:Wzz/FepE/Etk N-terminal domain-containing protein [Hippea sp. KM1]
MDKLEKEERCMDVYQDDEIDLYELWERIWKYRKFIVVFTLSLTIITVVATLFMENIYKSSAVILPTKQGSGGSSLVSQYSGIASLVGISLPGSGGSDDIMALLKSRSLKRETIEKYNLLPVILYKSWDSKNKRWIEKEGIITKIKKAIFGSKKQVFNKEEIRMSKAIKSFSDMIDVNEDKKLGTISVSVEYPDPVIAANLVGDLLSTLKDRMTKEAIEIAKKRKKILEDELNKTQDPTIQQKLYSLIAKQEETMVMAKVSEDFAFKVIDPPQIPIKKYKPKRKLIVIVAFIMSLILGIFLVFFVEFIKEAKNRRQEMLKEESA